jgi:hypothetical protein
MFPFRYTALYSMLYNAVLTMLYNAVCSMLYNAVCYTMPYRNVRLEKKNSPLSPFSLTVADLVNNHSNPKAEMREHDEKGSADYLILPTLRSELYDLRCTT